MTKQPIDIIYCHAQTENKQQSDYVYFRESQNNTNGQTTWYQLISHVQKLTLPYVWMCM